MNVYIPADVEIDLAAFLAKHNELSRETVILDAIRNYLLEQGAEPGDHSKARVRSPSAAWARVRKELLLSGGLTVEGLARATKRSEIYVRLLLPRWMQAGWIERYRDPRPRVAPGPAPYIYRLVGNTVTGEGVAP